MFKRIMSNLSLLLVVSLLFMITSKTELASAENTELFAYSFDNQAEDEELFTAAKSSEIEWVNASGIGHNDDSSLKVSKIDNDYTSFNNAVRLTFKEPLPAGAVYNISGWFYAPSEGNEGKDTLVGPAVLLNGNTADNTFKLPSPDQVGTLPTDQWKEVNGNTPMMAEPLKFVDFRLYTNDRATHADLWYLDNIVITQIGDVEALPEWDLTLSSLKETYKDYFPVGNIMEPNHLRDEGITEMYKYHYNLVSAENSMKPASLSRGKGSYNFGGADALVDWANENGIGVHGHTLVWHSQSADWVNKDESGNPLTREEARANMEEYINNVAGHFKGRVVSWDVVNEAFDGGSSVPKDWKTVLRKKSSNPSQSSYWYMAYENGADASKGESGADYIYDAFVFTRLADPDAILFYNDFNENSPWKREAMALMAEDLNNQWKTDPRNTEPDRLLVEALGMQAHYWTSNLSISSIEDTIKRFVEAGVQVGITELDIPMGSYGSYTTEPSEEDYEKQAKLYAELFQVYKKYADNINRVTFWGKLDSQSWRAEGHPLLFDRNFSAKPAYYAVVDPEGFLAPEPSENEESVTPEPTEEPSPTDVPVEEEVTLSSTNVSTDTETVQSSGKLGIIILIVFIVIILAAYVAWSWLRKNKQKK
ncbi:MAG: endo-1,4-beta-xylanase [Clostridiales bacterium]|nr:endo-1,4-beta-xylanase [Clostridiales bacterium]